MRSLNGKQGIKEQRPRPSIVTKDRMKELEVRQQKAASALIHPYNPGYQHNITQEE